MSKFSVTKLVEEIKILTEMKIKTMEIDFEINIDPNADMAFGREVQISQVLVNLVNNSVDAVSVLENKWIKIVVSDLPDSIEFKVTDSGSGISKELSDKIMQPFFTTKEVGKGTGLGLSISKNIIEEHGGVFEYNSESPNTEFKFTITKSQIDIQAA